MRILILGANSFIGKYFVKHTRFNNLFLTSSKKRKAFIHFNLLKHNIEDVLSKYKITHVVFFTAISRPQDCQKNKLLSEKINVVFTKKAINSIIKKKTYFVFISSDYIFNGKKGNYSENSRPDARVLYGKQKLKIENFLKKKKSKNFSILRCPKTCGDNIGDKSIFTNFLSECLKKKKFFTLAKDQIFTALYVKDLIKIIDLFLKGNIYGKYNICGNQSYSRLEYCKRILKKMRIKNVHLKPEYLKNLSGIKNIPLNVSLDNSKIIKKINFNFTSFNQYINILIKKYAKEIKKIR